MKTQSEILEAIGGVIDDYTRHHANKLAAIFKIFAGEKKNIVSVDTEPADFMYGRIGQDVIKKHVVNNMMEHYTEHEIKNEGEKMPGMRFKVTTTRGRYSIVVPMGNKVFEAFCDLLHVDCTKQAEAPALSSIEMPAGVLSSIKKAMAFVSNDELRPAMQCVCIEITKKGVQVLATDAHRLYMSQVFKLEGRPKDGVYLLPASSLKRLPKTKEKFFAFDIMAADQVRLLGLTVKLTDANFPNWRVVVPAFKKGITFNRASMLGKIGEVLPSANKSTNQINFQITNCINLHAQDVDFSYESRARMAYVKKEILDMVIAFNGKFLQTVLKSFDADNILMLSEGKSTQGCIFTDGTDKILIMPLFLQGDEFDQPTSAVEEQLEEKPLSKGVQVFTKYLDYICTRNKTVIMHEYSDRVSVRFLRMDGTEIVRGTKTLSLANLPKHEILPALESVIIKHNQTFNIK